MANVISSIKVRNADGTYSKEQPIGTSSEYVLVRDGYSLFDHLGEVDYTLKGPLQKQIEDLRQSLEALANRVTTLENK